MIRYSNHAVIVASIAVGFLTSNTAQAASLQQVDRAIWGASGVPDYVNMYIYVPDNVAANPPLMVSCHSCGGSANNQINALPNIQAAADSNGFIIIFPEATGRNCWDVGTTQSLTHDGGGDTQAIAQMVDYTLSTYGADPERVYVMGGSSGAMMTQALLAVYPDVFRAGSARAGVPAGCWADGFDPGYQWSGNCAAGNTTNSAQEWGDQVRAMYPDYDGPRPRVQLFHATGDPTIDYNNMGEAIKEWTNVLGLSEAPDSTETLNTGMGFDYEREVWTNECDDPVLDAWSAQGGDHSQPGYEEAEILSFFGLDEAGGDDPQAPCPDEGGAEDTGDTEGTDATGIGDDEDTGNEATSTSTDDANEATGADEGTTTGTGSDSTSESTSESTTGSDSSGSSSGGSDEARDETDDSGSGSDDDGDSFGTASDGSGSEGSDNSEGADGSNDGSSGGGCSIARDELPMAALLSMGLALLSSGRRRRTSAR